MNTTHPNLWKFYMLYALGSIGLGLNFLFLTPTFMPLDVPKWPIGLALLGCGLVKLTLLLITWDVLVLNVSTYSGLRTSMLLSVIIYSFWAVAIITDFFRLVVFGDERMSLQLPLVYLIAAAAGGIFLTEPFSNPAMKKLDEYN